MMSAAVPSINEDTPLVEQAEPTQSSWCGRAWSVVTAPVRWTWNVTSWLWCEVVEPHSDLMLDAVILTLDVQALHEWVEHGEPTGSETTTTFVLDLLPTPYQLALLCKVARDVYFAVRTRSWLFGGYASGRTLFTLASMGFTAVDVVAATDLAQHHPKRAYRLYRATSKPAMWSVGLEMALDIAGVWLARRTVEQLNGEFSSANMAALANLAPPTEESVAVRNMMDPQTLWKAMRVIEEGEGGEEIVAKAISADVSTQKWYIVSQIVLNLAGWIGEYYSAKGIGTATPYKIDVGFSSAYFTATLARKVAQLYLRIQMSQSSERSARRLSNSSIS